MPAPRLSLCIPTYNRCKLLPDAIEGAMREIALHPEGVVELVVVDNASTDGTPEVIAALKERFPAMRAFRNEENLGFDGNYIRCVDEARGTHFWIMGDDDTWMPGAVGRVLQALDQGADFILFSAQECDNAFNRLDRRHWFLEEWPERDWEIGGREDFRDYLEALRYEAGCFAFISAAVLPRERILAQRHHVLKGVGQGFVQVWGAMAALREGGRVHWIPDMLILNRIENDHVARTDPFGRCMWDLRAWTKIGQELFGEDEELRAAFMRVMRSNHGNRFVSILRGRAPSEEAWLEAREMLLGAGYPPAMVESVDLGLQLMLGKRVPPPALDVRGLCLLDLGYVFRGARRASVLALGPLEQLPDLCRVLEGLRRARPDLPIQVWCEPLFQELLHGFEVRPASMQEVARDKEACAPWIKDLAAYAPDLLLNLNPQRSVAEDMMLMEVRPAGALGLRLVGERDEGRELAEMVDAAYTALLPPGTRDLAADLLERLGLEAPGRARWPLAPRAQEEAAAIWGGEREPGRSLALLGDDLSDPALPEQVARAVAQGFHILGLGGPRSYGPLEALLGPLDGQGLNLAGALSFPGMAALAQDCAGHLGGSPALGLILDPGGRAWRP